MVFCWFFVFLTKILWYCVDEHCWRSDLAFIFCNVCKCSACVFCACYGDFWCTAFGSIQTSRVPIGSYKEEGLPLGYTPPHFRGDGEGESPPQRPDYSQPSLAHTWPHGPTKKTNNQWGFTSSLQHDRDCPSKRKKWSKHIEEPRSLIKKVQLHHPIFPQVKHLISRNPLLAYAFLTFHRFHESLKPLHTRGTWCRLSKVRLPECRDNTSFCSSVPPPRVFSVCWRFLSSSKSLPDFVQHMGYQTQRPQSWSKHFGWA